MSAPLPTPTHDAPSGRRLLRSTIVAAGVAALILVTIVFPAEYGVDPTGVGRLLGLTSMGETKMRLAAEAEADAAADVAADAGADGQRPVSKAASPTSVVAGSTRSDSVTVTLAPAQAAEYKLAMRKDATARFAWSTDRGAVNYDTHGDAPGIRYHPYKKGTAVRADSGSLTAAFDGHHGWFWRNRGADTVSVTLHTRGEYSEIKRVQ